MFSQNTNKEAFGVDISRSRGIGWQGPRQSRGEGGKEEEEVNKSFGGIFGFRPCFRKFRSGFDVGYIVILFSSSPLPIAGSLVSKDCI